MIDGFLSNQGIQNMQAGNPILSILECAAQSDLRSSQDIFNLLNAVSLDKATGLALLRIGADERVPQIGEAPATGLVDLTDTSFVKIATKLFQGRPAPIIGATSIDIADGTLIPDPLTSTVKIYLSRGTANYEGPLTVTSATNNGDYWTLGLSAPTTKYHNAGDGVVLAQGGNRVIATDTIVQTPQANLADAVSFRLIYSTTLPDGEIVAQGIAVVAQKPGTGGNTPANAISQFVTPPFTGASVTNPLPISNGVDTENDDTYRERIKNVRKSRTQGTALAITTAVTGITAPDEGSRVTSAALVSRSGYPTILYIDNGVGYEEKSKGIAIETLVDSAIGGEQYFETTKRPITKAFIQSENAAPFTVEPGSRLAVRVGGTIYTHSFALADFVAASNASAFEVVASVNANQDLGFTARLAEAGAKVVLGAKADANEDLQIEVPDSGVDANEALRFPAGGVHSIQLYKNDHLLSKDGRPAVLRSQPFSSWDTISGSKTLTLAVDNTPAITFTFIDLDFVNANTGYVQVGKNSVEAWCRVINAKVPGVTATPEGSRVVITSNAGPQTKSAVEVTGGELVALRMFATERAEGESRDYTVDRNYSQIRLEEVLDDGDRLSIGSASTRSFLESAVVPTTSLADPAKAWFAVDSGATIIEHGVGTATSLVVAVRSAHSWGHRLSISSPTAAFLNVRAGDWLVLWDSAVPASLQGAHRVTEVTAGSQLTIDRREALTARTGHRSVAMVPEGASISKVLTCGGHVLTRNIYSVTDTPGTTEAAEVYDPNPGTEGSAAVRPMGARRAYHTATVLSDGTGRVLVTGGQYDTSTGHTWLASTELYDPATGLWTNGPSLSLGVSHHRAVRLLDGRVLVCGGMYKDAAGVTQYSNRVSVYNPGLPGTFTHLFPVVLATPRSRFGAVLLGNGNVMIAGGEGGGVALASVEIFQSTANIMVAGVTMHSARRDFGIAALTGDSVLVAGADLVDLPSPTADTFTVFTGTWSADAVISGLVKFSNNDLIKLSGGTVIAFNTWRAGFFPSAMRFTPGTGLWTTLPSTSLNKDQEYFDHRQHVLLSNSHTISIGGRDNWSGTTTANILETDGTLSTSAAWSVPDDATSSSLLLGDKGIAFVRTSRPLQEVDIPPATDYTANAFVAQLNSQVPGATATVYRTNQYRLRTNTFATSGDIALVAADAGAGALQLTASDAIRSLTGHLGSVETANSEYGTPSFEEIAIVGQVGTTNSASNSLVINTRSMRGDYAVVGLRGSWGGYGNFFTGYHERYGDNLNFESHVEAFGQHVAAALVHMRESPVSPWMPQDRVYLASPFAIGPSDDLTVLVDNDPNKRFPIRMWRKLKPAGTTYSTTNAFRDVTDFNVSMAGPFGLGYDFNDFAVYMRPRVLAYGLDAGRKLLLRYNRFGADGEGMNVRFEAPATPDQVLLGLEIEPLAFGSLRTTIRILLSSGPEKSLPIHANTRMGMAVVASSANTTNHAELALLFGFAIASASRTSNTTTLTLQLPAGIATTGLGYLTRIYVKSVDSNFASGRYTIDAAGAPSGIGGTQTITYVETAANHGSVASIGTLSTDDAGEILTSGLGITAPDFVRISPAAGFEDPFSGTFVVTSVGPQFIKVKSGDQIIGTGDDNGTVTWGVIDEPTWVKVFTNPAQTAAQVASAINVQTDWPISAVSLGTGAGSLAEGTGDATGDPTASYTLVDGLNWVSKTISPLTTAGNYQLTFKKAPDGSLSTGSDWVNEQVRIVPITASGIVRWLNTPTVTGLFTAATIEVSSHGSKVQIASRTTGSQGSVQVQGGLANALTAAVVGNSIANSASGVVTVSRASAAGLSAGMWCRIENQITLPKGRIINEFTALVSWSADGLIELNSDTYTSTVTARDLRLAWEKQGNFVAIHDPGTLNPGVGAPTGAVSFGQISEGQWLRVTPAALPTSFGRPVPVQNQGIFRVVKVASGLTPGTGAIWIENPGAVEGMFEGQVACYTARSIMPGDSLAINTDAWGDTNRGTWVVEKVGVSSASSAIEFTDSKKIKVSTATRAPQPVGALAALGTIEVERIQVIESKPSTLIKRITSICNSGENPAFVDLGWDSIAMLSQVTVAAGSIIAPLDKLAFTTNTGSGRDGYNYSAGLIGQANKVIYGDANDTASYPGVAAAGAQINIQGPLIRRIQVALNIRVRSGAAPADIANRVRSAVAAVINQSPLGKPVAISSIVAAGARVPGVIAVSVLSPLYAVGRDLIPVQPYEKALVLNLEQDIGVTFSGD